MIRHNAALPLVGAAAGLGCAVAITVVMPPTYEAEASVILSPTPPDGENVKSFDPSLAQSLAPSLASLVSSQEVARMAAASLGLDERQVLGRLTGETQLGVQIVRVHGQASTAAGAAAVANAGADAVSRLSDRLRLGGASAVTVTILDSARVPTTSIYPRPLLNMALGTLVGGLAGLCLLELRRRFDDRFRRIADVEKASGLSVLGLLRVPRSRLAMGGVRLFRQAAVAAEMDTTISAIQASGTPARRILVTGVADAESVAGVAGLLTAAWRRRGETTTLIDGQSVRTTALPAVPEQAESHQLLRRSGATLDRLSDVDTGHAVISAPPVLAGGDLPILARQADTIVLVVPVDEAGKAEVTRAAAVVRAIGVPAFVLVTGGAKLEDGWSISSLPKERSARDRTERRPVAEPERATVGGPPA